MFLDAAILREHLRILKLYNLNFYRTKEIAFVAEQVATKHWFLAPAEGDGACSMVGGAVTQPLGDSLTLLCGQMP